MRVSTALAVMSAVAASAQSLQNYTSSLDMKIDTAKVPIGTRAEWCRGQTNTCGLLCDNNTDENSCAQDTLEFKCTCASNHSMPGLQFYTQTVPTYICQELFGVCKSENAGKKKEQEACDRNIEALCGKTNPPKVAVSSSDNGGDSSESATSATQQSPKQTNGAASLSSSRGLAAPTRAPAGPGAAAAAAAMGFLAYLL